MAPSPSVNVATHSFRSRSTLAGLSRAAFYASFDAKVHSQQRLEISNRQSRHNKRASVYDLICCVQPAAAYSITTPRTYPLRINIQISSFIRIAACARGVVHCGNGNSSSNSNSSSGNAVAAATLLSARATANTVNSGLFRERETSRRDVPVGIARSYARLHVIA